MTTDPGLIDLTKPRLKEYLVMLSSAEEIYILATDSMDAAFHALELSEDRNCKLINVRLADEW